MIEEKVLHIVDSYSTNYFHEVFNAGMMIVCAQDADQVIYHADRSSQKNVISLIKEKGYEQIISKIECQSLYTVRRESTFGALLRTYVSAFQKIRYLFKGGRGPILFMHNDAFSIYLLRLFSSVLKRQIWIVCHGELELLIRNPRWYKPSFLYKCLFNIFFKYVPVSRYMHFIVLGESIRDNLKAILPDRCENYFVAIHHPYFFKEKGLEKDIVPGKILLGTVGTMNLFKGYQRLLYLAELLEKTIRKNKVTLTVVGKLENMSTRRNDLIHYACDKHVMLPRDKYAQLILELDYVLFLYNVDSYKLIASGAIFDAISFERPIIALKNDFFDSIFSQCGNIGYLCNSVDELYLLILKLLNEPDIKAYKTFLLNMRKARGLFAPECVKINIF